MINDNKISVAQLIAQPEALPGPLVGGYDDIIDVRSPAEYSEDHLPGAVSAPVLDDEERARIGTLHKQASAFDAKKAGAALVARNIARHLEEKFAQRPKNWRQIGRAHV